MFFNKATLCDENQMFLLFYKDLTNRHIFLNGTPTIKHRFESWSNYRQLFDLFLNEQESEDGSSSFYPIIPMEWLNDMMDEFLYQFQAFHAYKYHPNKSAQEIDLLEANPNVWKVHIVMTYLTSFVDRAAQLVPSTTTTEQQARHNILKCLGAFSIAGLCRLNCLLADYRLAIRVLDPLNLDNQRAIHFQVVPCAVNLYYSLGFAFLMSKRYSDAITVLSRVLMSHHRVNKESTTSYGEDLIQSKYDKVLALTAICSILCPGAKVDDSIKNQIMEKHEKLYSLQAKAMEETFVDMFTHACPKFIHPGSPILKGLSVEELTAKATEVFKIQLKWFLDDVRMQLSFPVVKSMLKLYKTIPAEKLSKSCNMDADAFKQALIFIKMRSSQLVRTSDSITPMDGVRLALLDVHFFIVGDKKSDMIHIVSSLEAPRFQQNFNKVFLAESLKLKAIVDDV